MQTIYEATEHGRVNLRYEGGVYEFARQLPGAALPNFAIGIKVSGDGRNTVIRNWSERLPKA